MMKRARLCAAVILAALAGTEASAGAWTRPAGEVFTSQTLRYFSTEFSTSSDVDFAQSGVNVYAEYGVVDSFTIGFETDQGLRLDDTGFGQQGGRVGGFARARLWTGEAGDVASVQFGGSIPIAAAQSAAVPSSDKADEIKGLLQYGRGFVTPYGNAWADVSGGFAHLTGGRADEYKLDLTAGIRPDENWIAIGQVFVTKSRRNAAFGAPDFDIVKAKLSVGRKIFGEQTLLVGLQRDVYTRNTSPGWEASLTIWSEF